MKCDSLRLNLLDWLPTLTPLLVTRTTGLVVRVSQIQNSFDSGLLICG